MKKNILIAVVVLVSIVCSSLSNCKPRITPVNANTNIKKTSVIDKNVHEKNMLERKDLLRRALMRNRKISWKRVAILATSMTTSAAIFSVIAYFFTRHFYPNFSFKDILNKNTRYGTAYRKDEKTDEKTFVCFVRHSSAVNRQTFYICDASSCLVCDGLKWRIEHAEEALLSLQHDNLREVSLMKMGNHNIFMGIFYSN